MKKMENEQTDSTQGANVSEKDTDIIQQAGVPSLDHTTADKSSSEKEPWYAPSHFTGLIKSLTDNLSFTILFIAIVGYIIIASFKEMQTLDQFFRYIIFLGVSFMFYKFISMRDLNISFNINKKGWFFIITYTLLVLYFIISNFNYVKSFIEFIIKLISPPSISLPPSN
jgi:uncharacterized membrane protein